MSNNNNLDIKNTETQNCEVKPTSIGGSALMEGLMMIGPENAAIGVRMPDGNIVMDERPVPKRDVLSKIWIVRGVVNFFRQMILVYKAMTYSAHFFDLEGEEKENKTSEGADFKEEKQSKFDAWLEKVLGTDKAMDVIIYISIILSLGLSVLLFSVAPYSIVDFFSRLLGIGSKAELGYVGNLVFNLCSGAVRITIFICYLLLASMMKDIKRVWQYHGAEHKTIHCYEHGEELTVENIRKYSKHHPRCGTSFLLIVMVLGILVVSAVKLTDNWLINLLIRIVLIPLIAGVSYEVLKFAGTSKSKCITWLNIPGMWFQRLTTKEPDDEMIEVAIVAMINAMPKEEREATACPIPFKTNAEVEAEKAAKEAEKTEQEVETSKDNKADENEEENGEQE